MKLANYFDKELVFINVKGNTQEEVIKNMVESLSKKEKIIKDSKEEIKKAIIKRENEISTAIGMGVAIPHARIQNFNDFIVAVGLLEKPIEVQVEGLLEKDKVKVIFLIISDILKNKNMLKILGGISKIALKNPISLEKIKNSKTEKEVIEAIEEINIEFGHKIIADDVLSPDIEPVTEDTTLEVVAKRLINEKISGIPVVDEKNNFLGEITEKELIEYGMPKYLSLMKDLDFLTVGEPFEEYLLKEETATIKDLYRRKENLYTIDKKTPIMEICFIMVKKGITRIYVVENGKLYGVIRRYDIIKKVLHI
ncbi:MAG: PTS sugar transporter subunit IIA [Fusobacterium perfoetens]|uniref:PTS sugar transporter subunit IIA n=2 Tax=Fusobacterium perfoetens TaxID=852 RepID=UPI0023F36B89|nr:PTS sugar transporter subunit IIA [Fusobacterium perfoetens]MCI6152644.1 PTS sugar transporter subunit IIA [Fusobacterium perfoetens]MDY3237651.1 PTS sugar transporter subunit IIA [Fusobacterium perfoetens]